MYLYYTSVTGQDVIQQKSNLSLGGYKALNRVNSGLLNNFFSDISQLTISNYNQNTFVGLILKNELPTGCSNIKLHFTYPTDSYSKLKIAAVSLVQDSEGFLQMEHIETPNSTPLFATFYEADGVDNAINIGDLASGEMVGLWIQRELLLDFIDQDQAVVYELDPERPDRYKEKELSKLDEILLNISWD